MAYDDGDFEDRVPASYLKAGTSAATETGRSPAPAPDRSLAELAPSSGLGSHLVGSSNPRKRAQVCYDTDPHRSRRKPRGEGRDNEPKSKAASTPVAASEDSNHCWSKIEVTADCLIEDHPPLLQLVGADVCVMAAAYPTYTLSRSGAIGWRGLVTHSRGGTSNPQVASVSPYTTSPLPLPLHISCTPSTLTSPSTPTSPSSTPNPTPSLLSPSTPTSMPTACPLTSSYLPGARLRQLVSPHRRGCRQADQAASQASAKRPYAATARAATSTRATAAARAAAA